MTNRRGFLAALMALPTAAMATLRHKPRTFKYPIAGDWSFRSCVCHNCTRPVGSPSEWRWVPVGPVRFYPLCNDCIKAITHCATCGDPLSELDPASVALYLESNPSPPYDSPRTPLPPNPAYCIIHAGKPVFNFTSDEILRVDDPQSPLGVRFRRATLRLKLWRIAWAGSSRNLIVADCPICANNQEVNSSASNLCPECGRGTMKKCFNA
jgi:hypothetical protein